MYTPELYCFSRSNAINDINQTLTYLSAKSKNEVAHDRH